MVARIEIKNPEVVVRDLNKEIVQPEEGIVNLTDYKLDPDNILHPEGPALGEGLWSVTLEHPGDLGSTRVWTRRDDTTISTEFNVQGRRLKGDGSIIFGRWYNSPYPYFDRWIIDINDKLLAVVTHIDPPVGEQVPT